MTARSSLPETTMTGVDGCSERRNRRPENPRTPGMVKSSSARSAPPEASSAATMPSKSRASTISASGAAASTAWRSPPTTSGWSSAMSTRKPLPSLIVPSRAVQTRAPGRESLISPLLSRPRFQLSGLFLFAFLYGGQASELTQGFRHRDRRSDAHVQGPQARLNGDRKPGVGRRLHGFGHASRLAPHEKNIQIAKAKIPQTRFAVCCQEHEPPPTGGAPGFEARPRIVALDRDRADIVHRGALEATVGHSKSRGLDDRRLDAKAGAGSHHRASVLRDIGLEQGEQERRGGPGHEAPASLTLTAMDIQFDRCEKPHRAMSRSWPRERRAARMLGGELTISGPSRKCSPHLPPSPPSTAGPQNALLAGPRARTG